MGGAWHGDGGFWGCINDVVYYLDGGVVGLVILDLIIGVGFWMRCGDVISQWLPHEILQLKH